MIDNYNKLSIGKFMEIQDIDFTGMEEIDIQVSLIAILNDMTEDEVMDLPLNDYKDCVRKLKFLATKPEPKTKIPKAVKLDGKEYTVIKDIKEMTAGQYIDYQNYLSHKENKYLPHILSCFIIPKGEKYGDSNLMEIIEIIKTELPIGIALNMSAFFLKKWESLTKGTLTYLGLKMKWMMRKEKNQEVKKKIQMAIKNLTTLRNSIDSGVGLIGLYK